jgi:hypothetical protein
LAADAAPETIASAASTPRKSVRFGRIVTPAAGQAFSETSLLAVVG